VSYWPYKIKPTMADQAEDKDKTILALTKQNETLTKENGQLKSQAGTLSSENEQLKKAVIQKDNDLEDAASVVEQLKTQLAEKKIGTVELPTVKLGKETYELVGGNFYYGGREVSLETLKEDAKLVAELVKEKVGNLRLLKA
jgi:predicted RNase H-like nuclease (RuvC/YqgF family)